MMHTHSLERAARYYPERTALVSSGKRSTFRALHDRVGGIAAALHRRGFRAGDRLALLLPNEPEYIELVYVCSWLGVIAVPLNTRLSSREIDRVLADADPRGLIRHSSLPEPGTQVPWQVVLDQEELEVGSDEPPEPVYDPDAILALIYTSGTTGRPKGVMLTHAAVLATVEHLGAWMEYREGGAWLHAAPMFHIADFPVMFAAPGFGACQVTIPKFTPQGFCDAVARERVSHAVLVPTMINLLAQFPGITEYDLTSLEVLGYGGSPMAPELIHRTRTLFPGIKLIQVYGLSETGFLTGLMDHEHTEQRLKSCGRPCIGIDVRVVDETGRELGPGQTGELVARGANVMRGYWNNPAETALAFRGGMFRTGDGGYQDGDGYFYILDRLKDMIVTGGENVYSGEVEAVIYEHPAVREVAVLKPGHTLSVDELLAHCRQSLANYKVPRRVEFSESELAKSGSGKILKRVLRERFWEHQERAVS
jgi:long-chain acyl-CoA synthetase